MQLGAAPSMEATSGFDVGEMVSVGTISSPADWNWKVSVENFLESYHHRGVHPATLDTTFPGHRSFASDPAGEPWAAVDHVSTANGAEPFIAITVFPTLVFAVVRGVGLTWFRLEPVSELASALTIDVLVLPEFAHDAALGEMLVSSTRAINDEDVPINQRTKGSPEPLARDFFRSCTARSARAAVRLRVRWSPPLRLGGDRPRPCCAEASPRGAAASA